MFLLLPLYKTWMEGKYGGTIGKRAMNIKVVQAPNWEAITYKKAFGRNILLWFLFVSFVLYYYLEGHSSGATRELFWALNIPNIVEAFRPWYLLFIFLCWFVLLFSRPPRAPYDYWAGTVAIHSNDQNKP